MEKERQLYIISGCNGAGKTTASYTVLPDILDIKEYVNSDEIARGLSPFNPSSVSIQAGRLMLKRIDELLAQGLNFGLETTLSTRSYVNLVKRAHKLEYKVNLLYFWIESPEMAEMRVAKRVAEGGHDIPRHIIYRRYKSGLENLFNLYMPVVYYWAIFDNSTLSRVLVADGGLVVRDRIFNVDIFNKIQNYVGTRSSSFT